ncbi:protein of unknown function [Methylocaldum szegediense]|uniref:Transposase n=1 Tax=Methylocaldum szegediense TaxID=73780 RepID=A0ABM9I5E3_9GAMM|nr:protein of unknown function [Methylocaldum szegediense]
MRGIFCMSYPQIACKPLRIFLSAMAHRMVNGLALKSGVGQRNVQTLCTGWTQAVPFSTSSRTLSLNSTASMIWANW